MPLVRLLVLDTGLLPLRVVEAGLLLRVVEAGLLLRVVEAGAGALERELLDAARPPAEPPAYVAIGVYLLYTMCHTTLCNTL